MPVEKNLRAEAQWVPARAGREVRQAKARRLVHDGLGFNGASAFAPFSCYHMLCLWQ